MSIEVRACSIPVTSKELGLTRDRFTKSLLRQALEARMDHSWGTPVTISNPPDMQAVIEDFAEKLRTGAASNVQEYFAKLHDSGYTAGGKRASSRPLLYKKRRLLPSSEDIGALGEGITGYYSENHEGLLFEVRPFGVSPDLVFREPSSGKCVLVEVKTSLHSGNISLTNAVSLLGIQAKTKFIRKGLYTGFVVQVNISSPSDFQLQRLEMVEV